MKQVQIFAEVTGNTLDDFVANVEQTEKIANYLHLNCDRIADLKPSDLETIKKACTKDSIFTCRSKKEGGTWTQDEKKRVEILQKALERGFDHVDIELETLEKHSISRSSQSKLIVSYHNLVETPKYWKLNPLLTRMYKHNPDVIKIATTVYKEEDTHTLFRLLVDKDHDEDWIIQGMGEPGKITRILSPILGGYLTYASTPYSESAPGQIQLEELKKVYDDLHIRY